LPADDLPGHGLRAASIAVTASGGRGRARTSAKAASWRSAAALASVSGIPPHKESRDPREVEDLSVEDGFESRAVIPLFTVGFMVHGIVTALRRWRDGDASARLFPGGLTALLEA
jgi:hypothetical protein